MPKISISPTLICPITQQIMKEPVKISSGHTYEKAAIAKWLENHDTNPITNEILSNKLLTPNLKITDQINNLNLCTTKEFVRAMQTEDLDKINNLNFTEDIFNEIITGDGHIERKNTLLHYAATLKTSQLLEYMILNGAKCDVKNACDQTPLHFAIMTESYDSMKVLLAKKADLNAKTIGGNTPLHFAAALQPIKYVQILLEYGASPTTQNLEGKIPADFASSTEIAIYITQHEATAKIKLLEDKCQKLEEFNRELKKEITKHRNIIGELQDQMNELKQQAKVNENIKPVSAPRHGLWK